MQSDPSAAATPTATSETDRLIASDKVEGTSVYNRDGQNLGSIYNLMVDKRPGHVEYAVLSFGGFLGIGEDFYPLPWQRLSYDPKLGGYVVNLDKSVLDQAPSYAADSAAAWDEPGYGRRVDDFWGGRLVEGI